MIDSFCCSSSPPVFGIARFWVLAILIGVWWFLIVLICDYLTTKNVEQLFISLFNIYVYSFWGASSDFLSVFILECLFSCYFSSLHTLDVCLLSDVVYQIFFVTCLFIFLTMSFLELFSIFECATYQIFHEIFFWPCTLKVLAKNEVNIFSHMLSSRSLCFCILHFCLWSIWVNIFWKV